MQEVKNGSKFRIVPGARTLRSQVRRFWRSARSKAVVHHAAFSFEKHVLPGNAQKEALFLKDAAGVPRKFHFFQNTRVSSSTLQGIRAISETQENGPLYFTRPLFFDLLQVHGAALR